MRGALYAVVGVHRKFPDCRMFNASVVCDANSFGWILSNRHALAGVGEAKHSAYDRNVDCAEFPAVLGVGFNVKRYLLTFGQTLVAAALD